MLRHGELFDPIQRTREMKLEEFRKYIDICDQVKGPTDATQIAEIRDIFFNSHSNMQVEDLEKIWRFIDGRVAENPGLAQFVLDYGGAKSDYLFPWMKTITESPSAALELSYGSCYDLRGAWTNNIPRNDPINDFMRNVPTLVYNRQRQLYVADLVTTAQDNATAARKSRVVDLGAGRLAWARRHGFRFRPERQVVLAFDTDDSICPDALFREPLEDIGLSYNHTNMMEAIYRPECQGADVVLLGGVASYYPIWVFCETVVKPAYRALKPGGVFFFDLQLECPQYVWTAKMFGWSGLNLMKSAAYAIQIVEQMRAKLRDDGMVFGAEYVLDTYSLSPSSVMVLLTKA